MWSVNFMYQQGEQWFIGTPLGGGYGWLSGVSLEIGDRWRLGGLLVCKNKKEGTKEIDSY